MVSRRALTSRPFLPERFQLWRSRLISFASPAAWACFLLALLLRALLAAGTRYTSEDYMITLRYAENLSGGHGMVYTAGERVLGTTTPLYTLLLALFSFLHLDPTFFGKSINILADSLTCVILFRWMRNLQMERAGLATAFIIAIHPLHIQWAISGMETGLVTLMGVWAWEAYSRRDNRMAFIFLAVLFLLRWDSILMAAALILGILWRDRALPIKGILLYLVIITPWLGIATAYYGNPIPVTGQAKTIVYGWYADHYPETLLRHDTTDYGEGLAGLVRWESTPTLRRFPRQQKLLNYFVGSPLYLGLTLFFCRGVFRIARTHRKEMLPPALWFLAYLLAFLASRVLLFAWYLVPPYPVYAALGAVGMVSLFDPNRVKLPEKSGELPWRTAGVVMAILLAALTAASLFRTLKNSQKIEDHLRIPLGKWLDRHAGPHDRILLEPIGYIGYYARRPIIDVIGLVSPQVLSFYTPSTRLPWIDVVQRYRPEWCVLRPNERDDLISAARSTGYDWERDYHLAATWAYARTPQEPPLVFYVYQRRGR